MDKSEYLLFIFSESFNKSLIWIDKPLTALFYGLVFIAVRAILKIIKYGRPKINIKGLKKFFGSLFDWYLALIAFLAWIPFFGIAFVNGIYDDRNKLSLSSLEKDKTISELQLKISPQETSLKKIDFSIMVPPGLPTPVPINTPIPGRRTNVRISCGNKGIQTEDFVFKRNNEVVLQYTLAPAGGNMPEKKYEDKSGKDVWSYIPPTLGVTFLLNGTFEVVGHGREKVKKVQNQIGVAEIQNNLINSSVSFQNNTVINQGNPAEERELEIARSLVQTAFHDYWSTKTDGIPISNATQRIQAESYINSVLISHKLKYRFQGSDGLLYIPKP